MIIILKPNSAEAEIKQVTDKIRELGYEPHLIQGEVRTVVAAIGDETKNANLEALAGVLPAVDKVLPIQKRYKLISRNTHPEPTVIRIRGVEIGNGQFQIIAGPCSVENEEQMIATANAVRERGATLLRGGAFKPRTSPYDFQGLGEEGLELLLQARSVTGLPIVTEVVCESDLDKICEVADVLQIGARNAMNYSLLQAVGVTGKPVLLKRGLAATIEEWLLAAEYIVKRGNRQVILCERGIRTFENATRNTLDLSAVVIAKQETSLPVFVDPCHAAGRLELIEDLSKAAIAAGADGLMVEVHCNLTEALSDVAQQLTPEAFGAFVKAITPFIDVVGKTLGQNGKGRE